MKDPSSLNTNRNSWLLLLLCHVFSCDSVLVSKHGLHLGVVDVKSSINLHFYWKFWFWLTSPVRYAFTSMTRSHPCYHFVVNSTESQFPVAPGRPARFLNQCRPESGEEERHQSRGEERKRSIINLFSAPSIEKCKHQWWTVEREKTCLRWSRDYVQPMVERRFVNVTANRRLQLRELVFV